MIKMIMIVNSMLDYIDLHKQNSVILHWPKFLIDNRLFTAHAHKGVMLACKSIIRSALLVLCN